MMYKFYRFSAILALATLLSLPVFAETTTENDEPEVTVIVTAERAAQPVSESIATATIITAKEIQQSGAQTVTDALRMAPGVTIRQMGQMGAASSTIVRGTKSNQVLVLVDGDRVSSSAFISGADLAKIPLAEVLRIEVIRGPVSSLYGSDAIGGVINIITKQPTKTAANAVLGFGGNGRTTRNLSLQGGSKFVLWRLNGDVPAFDGTRPNSDFAATDLSAKIVLPSVKGWELSLRGERYSDTLGLPNSDPNHTGYFDPDDRQWTERESFNFTAKRDLGAGRLEWKAYRISQQLHNVSPGFDWMSLPVVYDSRITGMTEATELTYQFKRNAHQWVVGGEYRNEDYKDLEGGSFPGTQQENISNRALFVQDRWDTGPKTSLVLGARLDDHSAAGSKVTPRIGVTRIIGPKAHLRASYSEGFRAPNFVELFYTGMYGSGNPNLKPEKSRQFEVGISKEFEKDSVDLAVFTNDIRDLIKWETDPITWLGTYNNIQRARQNGVEFTWEHRFSPSASLGLSYSYINALNSATKQRLDGIPHNKISLTAARTVKSWEIALTGQVSDARPDLTFDPVTFAMSHVTVPGKLVLDLSLAHRGGKSCNPYVIIRNLTDVSHEEVAGYPAEGRSVEVGMRSSW